MATTAFAARDYDVTVSRTFTSGDPQSAFYTSIQCNIHLGPDYFGIEHRRRLGNIDSSEAAELRVGNAADVNQWITDAKRGPITGGPGQQGAAQLSYFAIQKTVNGTFYVDLKSEGALVLTNASPQAALLIKLLDIHCPRLPN